MPKDKNKRVMVFAKDVAVTIEYEPEALKSSLEKSLRLTKRSEEKIQAAATFATNHAEQILPELFSKVAERMMYESFHLALREMKVVRGNVMSVHKALLQDEHDAAKIRLSTPGRGQRSKWRTGELKYAVLSALDSLPPSHGRTYDNVAAVLQATHPAKAPRSGGALRVLLDRFRLDWKELKSAQ